MNREEMRMGAAATGINGFLFSLLSLQRLTKINAPVCEPERRPRSLWSMRAQEDER